MTYKSNNIYICFYLTDTGFQMGCQKEPKSELKSDFQKSISKSKFIQIFLFFCYQKVIVYSNVFFSLWLLSDNSQLSLVLKTAQVLLTYISGDENSIRKVKCKDKISTKKCRKLKKKGKCEKKKDWKKCMNTCQKCTPGNIKKFPSAVTIPPEC